MIFAIEAHLLCCAFTRLCGVITITPPRSFARALHLNLYCENHKNKRVFTLRRRADTA